MINLTELENIKQLVSQSKFNEAINQLFALMKNSTYESETILLKGNFESVSKAYNQGRIPFDVFNIEQNKLHSALLDLITEILESEFIKKYNHPSIKYIVGLDLGDGESTLSFCKISGDDKPEIFEYKGSKNILTAVKVGKISVSIGEEVINKSTDLKSEISLNFKYAPSDNRFALTGKGKDFVRVLYNEFSIKHKEITSKNSLLYIGHPASWTTEEVTAYSKLFDDITSLPPFQLISESKSALIYIKDNFTEITNGSFSGRVLVIDIGSSTTDITYLENFVIKPNDFPNGKNLGCRLIDEAILTNIMSNESQEWHDVIYKDEPNENNYLYLMYICRKYKEKAFGGSLSLIPPTNDAFLSIYNHFKTKLLSLTQNEILELKVDNHLTWREQFLSLLKNIKSIIYETPNMIVLTGGGSRMKFVYEDCSQVFSLNKGDLPIDINPSFTVSLGLTSYGKTKYKVSNFYDEINTFCNSDELKEIIDKSLVGFRKEFKNVLKENIIPNVVKPFFFDLRDGKVDTKSIQSFTEHIAKMMFDWLFSEKGLVFKNNIYAKFYMIFDPLLQERIRIISSKYNIDKEQLKIYFEIPRDAFKYDNWFDKVLNQLLAIYIKICDSVIPVYLRKLVPNWAMNLTFDTLDNVIQWISHDETDIITENNLINYDKVITSIKQEVKRELFKKIKKIEIFL